MPSLRDLLRRFRPVAAPGPAARAATPVDRVAEIAAELEPVFAALEEAQAQAEAIGREAEKDAEALRAAVTGQVHGILAEARSVAAAERAAAATERLRAADREGAQRMAEATREAERIRQHAAGALPDMVARVVAMVRATGTGEATRTTGREAP